MKFRGEISQGLCLGIDKLPQLKNVSLEEGMDVTELLGVREWQVPERVGSSGTIIGDRPGYIPKTDETRIQSAPELLKEFEVLFYKENGVEKEFKRIDLKSRLQNGLFLLSE